METRIKLPHYLQAIIIKGGRYFRVFFSVDYNECEAKRDSCDDNARCVNTAGSYKCFCSPGYVGDGFSCKSKLRKDLVD